MADLAGGETHKAWSIAIDALNVACQPRSMTVEARNITV